MLVNISLKMKFRNFSKAFLSVIVSLERDIMWKGGLFIFSEYVKPMEVIVDRIENNLVVVELDKGRVMTYRIDKLPSVKEGDVLTLDSDTKEVFVNKKKTKQRKKKIKKLMDKVFVD